MNMTVSQTRRIRLDLAYDGTDFHGWAAQPGLRTVEGTLVEALQLILREPVQLTVAGRTDAGVHARGQVVHVDVSDEALAKLPGRSDREPLEALLSRMAALLARSASGPKGSSDVVIHRAAFAPEGFDARFSALSRSYTYRICAEPHLFDPLRRHDVLWWGQPLDVQAMNRSAEPLLGEHDFLSFCKPREGATTIRELQQLSAREHDGIIEVSAQADAFCHSMVRTLVGTLIRVGEGSRPETWPEERLVARNRDGDVVVAPPHPLTLESVHYPEPEEYARRAQETRAVRTECCGD